MNLYLDDDMASALLARLLQQSGHDVRRPDAGLDGAADPIHLTYAVRENRVFLTGNYWDFELLHQLVRQAQGHHPGILVVRRDNDPRRDLTPRGIVRALSNLLTSGVALVDDLIVLNHWR